MQIQPARAALPIVWSAAQQQSALHALQNTSSGMDHAQPQPICLSHAIRLGAAGSAQYALQAMF